MWRGRVVVEKNKGSLTEARCTERCSGEKKEKRQIMIVVVVRSSGTAQLQPSVTSLPPAVVGLDVFDSRWKLAPGVWTS